MTTFFVVLTGFLVRIAVPLLLMVILVSLLRRIDERWQDEAILQEKAAEQEVPAHAIDLKECAISEISQKRSIISSEPCWQVFRQSNGYLHEECLHCKVFRAAPVLMPHHSH